MESLINILNKNNYNNSNTNNKSQNKSIKTITVKPGDNAYNIAKANNMSLQDLQLYNSNYKDISKLHPGDILNLQKKPYDTYLNQPNNNKWITSSFANNPLINSVKTQKINLKQEQALEEEYNKSNISAIQHAPHSGNYIIINKADKLLTVFDKNNNVLYSTSDISTGASGNDYNTVTYQNKGSIVNGVGNNSTPAGISMIDGIGEYHGAPSFTRTRINPETGEPYQVHPYVLQKDGTYKQDKTQKVNDQIASSIHIGNTDKKNNSNGCVRASSTVLQELTKYVGAGTMVYTLPQQGGSKFTLNNGKLNFTADNPYGTYTKKDRSDTGRSKELWDDYNVSINKQYAPLEIKDTMSDPGKDRMSEELPYGAAFNSIKTLGNWAQNLVIGLINKTDNTKNIIDTSKIPDYGIASMQEYYTNRKNYANALSKNKQHLQKELNLSSDEYNKLAMLSLGIADQESKFGTGNSGDLEHNYRLKQVPGVTKIGKAVKAAYKSIINNVESDGILSSTIDAAIEGYNKPISRGYSQIKLKGDNAEMQALYNKYNITENNISSADKSAIATMLRLATIYNNEVKGRKFKDYKHRPISSYDAVLYKWNGYNNTLKKGINKPNIRAYVNKVKRAANTFNYYEHRPITD